MRIIDNKKIDLLDSEWELYQEILKSYSSYVSNPEDLFKDLFETDNNGIIIFLKPPSQRQTSMQVFMFLMSIFEHQHVRAMHIKVQTYCDTLDKKIKQLDEKIALLSEKS